jgi:hypothetical protein
VVVTDNARHFSGLARHGVRVATCAIIAAELGAR